MRLKQIADAENVPYTDDGFEALLFTASGDMRQAINNLQATNAGFEFVNSENVFKVCDQPHPKIIQVIIDHCVEGNIKEAQKDMTVYLTDKGYALIDVIGTMFKVVKNSSSLSEYLKLEFLKEIGFAHKRALEGNDSLLQISGLLAQLCLAAHTKAI